MYDFMTLYETPDGTASITDTYNGCTFPDDADVPDPFRGKEVTILKGSMLDGDCKDEKIIVLRASDVEDVVINTTCKKCVDNMPLIEIIAKLIVECKKG